MPKIYELTTNGEDGYSKYLVHDIENDSEARMLAQRVFGKYYWENGISYYDDTERGKTKSLSKSDFIKLRKYFKR